MGASNFLAAGGFLHDRGMVQIHAVWSTLMGSDKVINSPASRSEILAAPCAWATVYSGFGEAGAL